MKNAKLEDFLKTQFAQRTAIVLLLCVPLGLVALAAAGLYVASTTNDEVAAATFILEEVKLALSVLGALGAVVAFVIGLDQYRTAQQWKRAEFLASELKVLVENPKVAAALTMVDWASRRIQLRALVNPHDKFETAVTLKMQSWALMPHNLLAHPSPTMESCRGDANEAEPRDGELMRTYSTDETIIRDCYDALLNGFDRLGSYVESGLISAKEVKPYIGYWIDDIATPTHNTAYALWCVCFLTYVYVYNFISVPLLFDKLGYDTRPDKKIFEGFVTNVDVENKEMAMTLQRLAKEADDVQRAKKSFAAGMP